MYRRTPPPLHNPQDELLRRIEAEADSSTPAAPAAATASASPADGSSSNSNSDSNSSSNSGGGSLWSRVYYLPTQADTAMLSGRRWLEQRAGGGPFRARQRQLLAPSSTSSSVTTAAEAPLPLISMAGPVVPGAVRQLVCSLVGMG